MHVPLLFGYIPGISHIPKKMVKSMYRKNFGISLEYPIFRKNRKILCIAKFLGYPWDIPYPDNLKIAMYRIIFGIYPYTNIFLIYVPRGHKVEPGVIVALDLTTYIKAIT